MYLKIDGNIEDVEVDSLGDLIMASNGGQEWYIFDDAESAGLRAREYWEDMVQQDPKEFTCLVGEETLVAWALGQSAGPGYSKVHSLEEWLDLWLDTPEEQWASYDGNEVEVALPTCKEIAEYLDIKCPEDFKNAVPKAEDGENLDFPEGFEEFAEAWAEQVNSLCQAPFTTPSTVGYRHN